MCNTPARADAACWRAASHSRACAVSVTDIFILGGTDFRSRTAQGETRLSAAVLGASSGPAAWVEAREVAPAGQSVTGRQVTLARQSSRRDNCHLMRKHHAKAVGNESSPPARPGAADCSAI